MGYAISISCLTESSGLMAILSVQNVIKEFRQGLVAMRVLKGITHSFDTGISYSITGVSGSGKSTLMHLLAGIDLPTSGAVLYNGVNVQKLSITEKKHFLNKTVGLVFQDPYLIKELSVVENVMLKALIAHEPYGPAHKHALELLAATGLSDKADHHPLSLSGGQQQRIAVLRALFNRPQFLLADEPTGNLDSENARLVIDLLIKEKELGMGLIVSSHDSRVAQRMDVQLRLADGILQ